jgi:microcystin-dependent protein
MPTEFTRNNIISTVPALGDSANVVAAFEDYHTSIAPDIDSKANKAGPTFTGTATFATTSSGNVTVTTLATLPSNTSIGSVSATEIGYLDGVTSNVQAQINTTLEYVAPTGSIIIWSTNTPPSNWLLCNGATVSRTTYAALFSVIGTTYGAGDGSTTFVVPNLMGRVPVGRDSNQTEFDTLAETGGAKNVTLAITNLPSHTHTGTTTTDSHSHSGTTSSAGAHTHTVSDAGDGAVTVGLSGSTTGVANNVFATRTTSSNGSHTHTYTTSTDSHSHTFTTAATGSGTAFSIIQPYLVLNYIIKT